MTNNLWIQGVVFIILGLLVNAAGLIEKIYAATKRPYAGYAEAKVVDIIPVERDRYAESRFRNCQAAVFEFYADGKLTKVVDTEDAYPCTYSLYQRVRLSYDPDNPENYCVLSAEKNRTLGIALNALGVILLLTGVMMFLTYALRYIL